ncbi:MAG: Fic family protein [Gammaproteobacteria bacterium]|nr:Fic family protein [Gammaproteobacteria bacterium]
MTQPVKPLMAEILGILEQHPEGLSRGEISQKLINNIENKTLQRRLAALTGANRIRKEGERRATKYFPLGTGIESGKDKNHLIFSNDSLEALKYLDIPLHSRAIMSYNRAFLEEYVPNETSYVPLEVRDRLRKAGMRVDKELAAGTYAKQICERLLIDLSYNSSRLEGNTYSLIDTEKLVVEGITAEGKIHEDSVMIMNHKEAILFLVENAEEIELNPFTIFNLHNLLSQDLLTNPESCGDIRKIEVNIGKSTYKPLNNPHLIRESLELLLLKARKIEDPIEQSFFVLAHMSYLQAFEDVNKRAARLASNIPFIKANLCPLSFTDISRNDYSAAMLIIYETNNVAPMVELFCYAYLRSCEQYQAGKTALGEIDAFRVQYRQQRKQVMGQVIEHGLHGKDIEQHIDNYCQKNTIEQSDKFIAMAITDLGSLHAGAIIGLGITQKQYEAWREEE